MHNLVPCKNAAHKSSVTLKKIIKGILINIEHLNIQTEALRTHALT